MLLFCLGIHFSKALFVPSMSKYNKVTSGASVVPSDLSGIDLSWQFNLQRIWEKIIHGKGMFYSFSLPVHAFLCHFRDHLVMKIKLASTNLFFHMAKQIFKHHGGRLVIQSDINLLIF